ncbi:DUF6508 domain-containing protein [Paraflavitalea sp. CAU 1676]|uniref:DUF6508 domain-containing protein n=1 Tax=Paraflavitalea sp. CAU 1676 TaxID=3032598 RepID=UPI0023D9CC0B|nr:DUF6508 domain-containing protein [Paraflavitalea sp. CAU 1676]MDF2192573.1 DUF6508 domain-containing protein [Paraflavitalea sp. CAU 1676]
MTLKDFPKEQLQIILSQYHLIEHMKPEDAKFVTSDHIPAHLHLITLLDLTGFMERFDYNAWAEIQGWDKIISPETLLAADFETLRKLITTHIRTDKFVQGHWDNLLINGYIIRFLARLQELYSETYSQS